MRTLLFPDPPRRIPRHRALGLTLRTAHLMTFGAVLGGHFFDVEPAAEVGSRRPLHCTSAGKVALAMLPADFVDRYIAKGLERYTAATITDGATLRAQLRRIRARGYGEARGERVPSLFGVAGPVVDPSGRLVAVVTIAGPAFRIRGHQREISGPLRDTVTAISRHLAA